MMNKLLVNIKHLCAGYNDQVVLNDISLKIYERDFLGITGPNGSGKTTLVKVILGLNKPLSGHIEFASGLEHRIGYMPQINWIDKKFPIVVSEVIASGLNTHHCRMTGDTKKRVKETIAEMGLENIAEKPIGELSGGQLQRTLLGRAIINHPELLILDEPNSYVDAAFESHFNQLLQQMNRQTAIVLISHDMDNIHSLTHNVFTLN